MEQLTDNQKWYRFTYQRKPYWISLRKMIKDRDGHRCQFCNTTEELDVHHLDYKYHNETIGRVDFDKECDEEHYKLEQSHLITLCRTCHSRYHTALKYMEPQLNVILEQMRTAVNETTAQFNRPIEDIMAVALNIIFPGGWGPGVYPQHVASILVQNNVRNQNLRVQCLPGVNVTSYIVPQAKKLRLSKVKK